MYKFILKIFIIFLLSIIGILFIRTSHIKKIYTSNEKKLKDKINFYMDFFKLYLEDKEKFYAKGRDYIMNRGGKTYNEKNVLTFQDKLNYLLIYENPEDKTKIVDKILLRNYSQKMIGKDICAKIFKIYNDVDEINLDELPEKFVLKCNHGSGMNIFCENKSKFNLAKAKHSLKKWMKINYGLFSFEYQYLNVKKRVFAEQYLDNEIINYKFSCFNGEPKFIRVKGKINGTNLYNIYYTNWTKTNFELDNEKYHLTNTFKKPINLEKMIQYSRLLSSEFCYCRVDFYEVNGIIYLSEITFTPFNSFVKYKKKEIDIYLGNLINISKIKHNSFQ